MNNSLSAVEPGAPTQPGSVASPNHQGSPSAAATSRIPRTTELLSDLDIKSIAGVNALPREKRRWVYGSLIPSDLMRRFAIPPKTILGPKATPLFQIVAGPSSVELELRHRPDARDPLLYLQLADTAAHQIEVVLFVTNDPDAVRFDTDRLPDGTPTRFGRQERNISEEIRAMEAGLAPGQVRRGLRLARSLLPILEDFVLSLRHDAFYTQPLAYHNAILFERLGFAYAIGRGRMEWIHGAFAPGGLLRRRLDGSTRFRPLGAHESVRGRSWAIHDGIMDVPYADIKMYKRVAVHAGIVTFPGAIW